MANINFVPDDYVKSGESHRTNLMYLVLLAVVMAALGGSFSIIKVRQRACSANEKRVDTRVAQVQQAIQQFEELQAKHAVMMKIAITTTELLEPVPRSVLLASLTNNLPAGTSLLELSLIQKAPAQKSQGRASSKYEAAQAGNEAVQPAVSREKSLETHMNIRGMAPSDLQVAAYIERLTTSSLLSNVALVESREYKVKDNTFRQFRLTAMLKKDVHLAEEDVKSIRDKAKDATLGF